MDLVAEQRLERRARILAAVRELLAERGWREVTIRDLARHCRVSVPTLYNQFGDSGLRAARSAQAELAAERRRSARRPRRPALRRVR